MRSIFSTDYRTVLSFALLIIGLSFWFEQPSQSFSAEGDAEPIIWDYSTTTIEALSLQAKLTELGNDGWDVFSIARYDAVVGQGADGQTRVTTEKFEVTARRPLK